jgi:CBS domain-containing protein
MKARDVMTSNPITVTPQATLGEVWDLMREADIRHVPVAVNRVLVGMMSDRDLASLDVARVLDTDGAGALRRALDTRVVSLMSSDVIFVEPEADLGEVVDLMIESKVGAIPVVLPDTREIVGITSYVDVLRAVQDLVTDE